MPLTTRSNINLIRTAIYAALGIDHYSASYRSRKLRQVCSYADGLDLRRRSDDLLGTAPQSVAQTCNAGIREFCPWPRAATGKILTKKGHLL